MNTAMATDMQSCMSASVSLYAISSVFWAAPSRLSRSAHQRANKNPFMHARADEVRDEP